MKTSRVFVTYFLFSLAATLCALAQELPDYYDAELRKISNVSKRAELEAALKAVHRPGNVSETHAAVRTILNSHQEDLVFLLFTNQNLSLGVGDTWADNDLHLLTRAMIHTIESHIISYELGGAKVARISERILEVLKRNGVSVDEGYHTMDDALTPKGFVWLEKWFQRAKYEATPGSAFYVVVEDCLQLSKAHHQRFLMKLDERAASASMPQQFWHWGLGIALTALCVVLFFKLR